jgi:hypothetical protein
VARELDDLAAGRPVEGVERRAFEGGGALHEEVPGWSNGVNVAKGTGKGKRAAGTLSSSGCGSTATGSGTSSAVE